MDPNSWVASNAVIIGRVELKKNSNIWFNATLRGDLEPIIIGEGSNIQDGSVIHTDPGCPTIVGKGVTNLKSKDRGMLVITHYQRLLDHIIPDFVHIMVKGKIIESGGPDLAKLVEKEGYKSFLNGN